MKNILKDVKLFIVGILLCHFNLSKAQVDDEDPYATLALQKKAIIGTLMNTGADTDEIGDSRWTMKFTTGGKCYETYTYDNGEKRVEIYTYKITGPTPETVYTYSLDLYGIKDASEYYSYMMYIGRDENNSFDEMSLGSGGSGSGVMTPGNFVFKKISESLSSKTPLKEEESTFKKKFPFLELTPMPDPQTRLEAYQAGEYDCEHGNPWGTSLRNKEYEMDYEDGWGKAGCPVRENNKEKTERR